LFYDKKFTQNDMFFKRLPGIWIIAEKIQVNVAPFGAQYHNSAFPPGWHRGLLIYSHIRDFFCPAASQLIFVEADTSLAQSSSG